MTDIVITEMSDRASAALHFMAGVGAPPEGDASDAFAELIKLGFVRELPDAVEGENPYPITLSGVRELAARREPIRGLTTAEELYYIRTRLQAALQYAVDAHAAVFRAMTAGGQEAIDSLGDDGYVHLAVHRVFQAGADKTARDHLDESTRAHMDAKDERITRLEHEAYEMRNELTGRRLDALAKPIALAPPREHRHHIPCALQSYAATLSTGAIVPEAHRWDAVGVVRHLAQAIEAADLEGVCVREHARWTLAALAVALVGPLDDVAAMEFIATSREHLADAIRATWRGIAFLAAPTPVYEGPRYRRYA